RGTSCCLDRQLCVGGLGDGKGGVLRDVQSHRSGQCSTDFQVALIQKVLNNLLGSVCVANGHGSALQTVVGINHQEGQVGAAGAVVSVLDISAFHLVSCCHGAAGNTLEVLGVHEQDHGVIRHIQLGRTIEGDLAGTLALHVNALDRAFL